MIQSYMMTHLSFVKMGETWSLSLVNVFKRQERMVKKKGISNGGSDNYQHFRMEKGDRWIKERLIMKATFGKTF